MIKCPLCDLTTGHSHFSYDIAEYVDSLRKQLIELQTDKVELIFQRDNWVELVVYRSKRLEVALTDLHDTTAQLVMDNEIIVALQAKLDMAVEIIKAVIHGDDVREDDYVSLHYAIVDAREFLAEISRTGGVK
jgi:ferredoxin-fold anticodon binding domain-containing protein